MSAALPREHGTKRGYDQHRRRGEEPCEECRQGTAEAARARRLTSGDADETKLRNKARQRALYELARMYPVEYHVLFNDNLAELGLGSDTDERD